MCKDIGGDVLFFIRKGSLDAVTSAMKWFKEGRVSIFKLLDDLTLVRIDAFAKENHVSKQFILHTSTPQNVCHFGICFSDRNLPPDQQPLFCAMLS